MSSQDIKHILEYDLEVDETDFYNEHVFIVDEIIYYNAYVKWADHQLLKKGMALTDENRRLVMDDIKLIRFPTTSMEKFVTGPAAANILTPEEKVELFMFMNQPKDGGFMTSFNTSLRYHLCL